MPNIDDSMFANVAKNGLTEKEQMEQFRKFLDVYNKKLASMKEGKANTDMDIEEVGAGSPNRTPSKKTAQLAGKIQSIKENEQENTLDPNQISPYSKNFT